MGIKVFGGINLYEPEDISLEESSWNSNCYYDKGKLEFQDYSINKESHITKIYERDYLNHGPSQGQTEHNSYKSKKLLYYEHNGDGVGDIKHGIPKPTVKLYFDYNNSKIYNDHFCNIAKMLNEKHSLTNNYYDAIESNLSECDMVRNAEIAVSYSGPYGESGLTLFKISNYIPYFFLEIPLFDKLNNLYSYDTFKNIKYLNIYIRYNAMTKFSLLDRYDFEVNDNKANRTRKHRNRYNNVSDDSSYGIDLGYPFVEYKNYDYNNDGDPNNFKNTLVYASGFFGYENDDKPALQWFIPNKIVQFSPNVFTEQQTYISDDSEFSDTESYDNLESFWDKTSVNDISDYKHGDELISTIEYQSAIIEDDVNGGEDGSKTEILTSEYNKNSIISTTAEQKKNLIYETAGGDNNHYNVESVVGGPITYQITTCDAGSDCGGDMEKPSPFVAYNIFQKSTVGKNRIIKSGSINYNIFKPEKKEIEFIVNKYVELDGRRLFLETINFSVNTTIVSFDLKDCVFNDDDINGANYLIQVWLKDSDLDSDYILIQEVDYKSWNNYITGNDESYSFEDRKFLYGDGSYDINLKNNIEKTIDHDTSYTIIISDGGFSIRSNYGSDTSEYELYFGPRLANEIASSPKDIYRLYGSAAKLTGRKYSSSDGGFSNMAEFYHDGQWKLHVVANPGIIFKHKQYLESVESIELTVQSIEYNYNDLFDLVSSGVSQEYPNKYLDMLQKQTISKHELYMDRLFKTIDDVDNCKSLMYYSEQSYPETFNPSSVFKFNDLIVHLENYRDKLYIFLSNEIKILSGSNNLTFILDRFYTDGAFEWTIVQNEDNVYFTNEKGIYNLSGGYPKKMSLNIQKFFDSNKITKNSIEFAEVKHSSNGDFYILKLNSGYAINHTLTNKEISMLLNVGVYSHNKMSWEQSTNSAFYEEANERFCIDKIAVSLRDGSIWFGSKNETNEFFWKSSEMVQETFFKLKSFKRLALDFTGKVVTLFSKNRGNDQGTRKVLPLTKNAISLGGINKLDNKRRKSHPEDWTINGERCYSNSVMFLSEDKKSILYKWEIEEVGYDQQNN